jgi:pimeloyl-ACP methyl ester carboxylesterase
MRRVTYRAALVFALSIAVLTLGLGVVSALHQPNTDIPEDLEGRHVTVRGVPVRVLTRGAGADVLLIHGSPGSIEDWAPVVDALAGSFRVTAYDRPGHGYSGDVAEYGYESNAEVAAALVDELELRNVVVVGHSYGGTTALALALRESPQAAAFVVIDSATYEPSRRADAMLRALTWPVLGVGIATVLGPLQAPRRIRQGLLEQFRGAPPTEEFIALRTRIWSTPKVTHAIASETVGAAENLARLSPRYRTITRPLFVLGQADDPFRRRTAERLHRAVPGSSLELLSGTGHYVQLEKTAEVVTTIRRAASAAASRSSRR